MSRPVLHLSHWERSDRESGPGEGLQPIERPRPPHPDPLPNGEREQKEAPAAGQNGSGRPNLSAISVHQGGINRSGRIGRAGPDRVNW